MDISGMALLAYGRAFRQSRRKELEEGRRGKGTHSSGEICSTENRIWNGRSVAATGNDEESARMGCISC